MVYQVVGLGWANIDAFRHGIERMDPVAYLRVGYYGRWLASLERLMVERGVLRPDDVDVQSAGEAVPPPAALPQSPTARARGFVRELDRVPRFRPGDAVRARVASPTGHTRLPRYVAGRRGVVHRTQPPCVFPDTNAHGHGEQPQHLYSVRFAAAELWGDAADAGTWVHIDLFEPYLEPVP
jgi:nitrile hydratase